MVLFRLWRILMTSRLVNLPNIKFLDVATEWLDKLLVRHSLIETRPIISLILVSHIGGRCNLPLQLSSLRQNSGSRWRKDSGGLKSRMKLSPITRLRSVLCIEFSQNIDPNYHWARVMNKLLIWWQLRSLLESSRHQNFTCISCCADRQAASQFWQS